jgi:hypothetical protein
MAKGLDIGTMNIISAAKDGEDVVFVKQRNAFMELESSDLAKSMLDEARVLYVENGDGISLLGEDAFKFATIFEREIRRPMKQGIISPKEKDGIPMMKLIMDRVLGEPRDNKEVLCISTPANPVDSDLDVLYHKKTMEALAKRLNYDTHVIDEGLAVIYSELADHSFTGLGISVGAGLTNVTLAYLATPVLSFSISRGGDWIDEQVAKATGLPREYVTERKERISKLDKEIQVGSPEGALRIYYDALITYIIKTLNKKLGEITPPKASFPVAIAGGSSIPAGFFEMFKQKLEEAKLKIDVSEIRYSKDPLNAVARGCLIAAKTQEGKTRKGTTTTTSTNQRTQGNTEKSAKSQSQGQVKKIQK